MINERSCGGRSGLSRRGVMLQPVSKTEEDNIMSSRAAVAHRNTGFVKGEPNATQKSLRARVESTEFAKFTK